MWVIVIPTEWRGVPGQRSCSIYIWPTLHRRYIEKEKQMYWARGSHEESPFHSSFSASELLFSSLWPENWQKPLKGYRVCSGPRVTGIGPLCREGIAVGTWGGLLSWYTQPGRGQGQVLVRCSAYFSLSSFYSAWDCSPVGGGRVFLLSVNNEHTHKRPLGDSKSSPADSAHEPREEIQKALCPIWQSWNCTPFPMTVWA